ncbi:Gfo/Idh/MocA family oxidoreductase (plasmid) [Deinococcus taeanensis]|uniref:Gfo/Idh/MocA family protein n=1 Tax=Deinococcus taeanensis TaxID=2737050 RepID=UPI001CDC8206|nr:Gfo/Idh/MocA family oxidoreductase [Deinococcus taeanensis]UBV44269.1 Gfo/Idh/MocA family oxidoreductase [Deinococcus taeanensis]
MTRVGIVGAGQISGIYLTNAAGATPFEVVAVADLTPQAAEARAQEYGIPLALSPEALLNHPGVDVVLNLTVPAAHAAVSRAALEAGKHVYSEKPLALTRDDGRALVALAQARGLRLGCAPDTFLGAGLQTCRQLIDEGVIGRPLAATAFMLSHGVEAWHANPDFFYQPGGGPLFDMGPYYLTALTALLGPVRTVSGQATQGFDERVITSAARRGERIAVQTPTHVSALLGFESGAAATLITSFDVWHAEVPRIEIYGSEGTLSLPDPNTFGGPVRLRLAQDREWREVPTDRPFAQNSRGLGLHDLIASVNEGRAPRASGALALHVLDVMHSTLDSAASGQTVRLTTTAERPAPLEGS